MSDSILNRRATVVPTRRSPTFMGSPRCYHVHRMNDRILLLWPKTTYQAEDFLAAAKRLGAEVVIGSDRCHELARMWPRGEEPYYQAVPLDFRDVGAAVEQIRKLGPVCTIVPTDDHTA